MGDAWPLIPGPGPGRVPCGPNVGEPLKPLVRIASGGETSRLMLALKAVLAQLTDADLDL